MLSARAGRETDRRVILAADLPARLSRATGARSRRAAGAASGPRRQPGPMTKSARTTGQRPGDGGTAPRRPGAPVPVRPPGGARGLSPRLCAVAAGLFAAGVASGWLAYLHRPPAREVHVPGTNAWTVHLILAAAACAAYGVARWRHRRRPGPHSGRLLLLAPLGARAAARLTATLRRVSWRAVAAAPLLGVIGYGFWRAGWQVTSGLDPSQVVNAWGGPSYPGAMAAHYLDCALGIAACAWLLDRILLPAPGERA